MNEKKSFEEVEKLINSTKETLKKEFFGIDDQIDQIMNNIKPWLIFPELQTRPLVINLWGLTGCGKTSLLNRIIELLGQKKHTTYFNFASIGEDSCQDIEESLIKNTGDMEVTTPIFIYDEFQHAKTIASNGSENNQPTLKIFWELLDSGKFISEWEYSYKYEIKNLHKNMIEAMSCPEIEIKNGQIIKGETQWVRITRDGSSSSGVFDEIHLTSEQKKELKEKEDNKTIFSSSVKTLIYEILSKKDPKKYTSVEVVYRDFETFNKQSLYDYITNIKNILMEDITLDFSKGLVFVVGNLDEAFRIAHDMNPDMSADQFNKITKKITSVEVKESLQQRFRSEQIARLGNIHIIYPAFSSQTYKQIIDGELVKYVNDVKKEKDISIVIDNSINDIIYKDSVFPTQGTRPIFSSIHEIIKTKLSDVLLFVAENGNFKFDKVVYKYKRKQFVVEFYDKTNKLVKSFKKPQLLRIEDLRAPKKDDFQVVCAIHESGHVIVGMELEKQIPAKISSTSTDSSIGGFVLKDFDKNHILNKSNLVNRLATYLGGRAAEEIIFGDDYITTGASSDLSKTNSLLISAIRDCGFGETLAKTGWIPNAFGAENKIYENDETNKTVRTLISEAYELAKEKLIKQKTLLLKMGEYLTKNPTISSKKLEEIIRSHYDGDINENLFNKKYEPTDYKDILNRELKKLS